jgi:hypothetical protein
MRLTPYGDGHRGEGPGGHPADGLKDRTAEPGWPRTLRARRPRWGRCPGPRRSRARTGSGRCAEFRSLTSLTTCSPAHKSSDLQLPLIGMHERSSEGPVPAEPTRPLPRLRVGSRQTRGHSPADSDICEPGPPAVPEESPIGIERRAALDDLGPDSIRRSKRCGSQKWEPTCSAALRRSTTRSDSSRRSMARSSTQSDSDRQLKRLRNSLTRKRSLVQIQYGPRFSNVCLAGGAKRGAQGGARSQPDPVFFWRFKIEFIAVAPVSMTGRSWWR